jgi:DNA-binding transcriptional LysR family regulator
VDLNWLEDFLALAEHRNFSRAAEARNVTQPAFSRRIRALEEWVGTPLVTRLPQGVAMNAAGEFLREQAEGLTRDLHQMRRGALKAAGREGAALAIAATHALSFTFFPGLIRTLPSQEGLGTLNLISDTMAACERVLLAGDADFLLCHARSGVPTRLTPGAFTHLVVGSDQLVPVSAPDASGAAQWKLPGVPSAPVRLLAYSAASGLGRILEATQREFARQPSLDPVFTSPLAAALHTMCRQGQGMAWLPRTMAAEDLAAGRLVEAGGEDFSIALEIRLVRPVRRQSKTAEGFWAAISRLSMP